MSLFYSCSAYNEIWHSTNVELNNLLEVELPKEKPKPEKVLRLTHMQIILLVSIGQARGISKVCDYVYKICSDLQETRGVL